MEIEVGEYVRTEKGTIAKIEDIEWDLLYEIVSMKVKYKHWIDRNKCHTEYIVKHSKNIIDLIEEGDIVKYDSNNSGTDVIEVVVETCKVDEDYDKGEGFICTILDDYIRSKYIKSIVTKEQFNQVKYEV